MYQPKIVEVLDPQAPPEQVADFLANSTGAVPRSQFDDLSDKPFSDYLREWKNSLTTFHDEEGRAGQIRRPSCCLQFNSPEEQVLLEVNRRHTRHTKEGYEYQIPKQNYGPEIYELIEKGPWHITKTKDLLVPGSPPFYTFRETRERKEKPEHYTETPEDQFGDDWFEGAHVTLVRGADEELEEKLDLERLVAKKQIWSWAGTPIYRPSSVYAGTWTYEFPTWFCIDAPLISRTFTSRLERLKDRPDHNSIIGYKLIDCPHAKAWVEYFRDVEYVRNQNR